MKKLVNGVSVSMLSVNVELFHKWLERQHFGKRISRGFACHGTCIFFILTGLEWSGQWL